jgi:hypothetical protein
VGGDDADSGCGQNTSLAVSRWTGRVPPSRLRVAPTANHNLKEPMSFKTRTAKRHMRRRQKKKRAVEREIARRLRAIRAPLKRRDNAEGMKP